MKNRLIHARFRIPLNLQLFADGGDGGTNDNGGAGGSGGGKDGSGGSDNKGGNGGADGNKGSGVTFSAEQLAEISKMLAGGTEAKENKTLQSYFKQQGMTEAEVAEAIKAYKAQRDANKPDVEGMQKQLSEAKAAAQAAQIREKAFEMCDEIGVPVKTMSYILKMADLGDVADKDGKIDGEKVKSAINKVLEDIPELKPSKKNTSGFKQIGSDGSGGSDRGDGKISLRDAIKEKLG